MDGGGGGSHLWIRRASLGLVVVDMYLDVKHGRLQHRRGQALQNIPLCLVSCDHPSVCGVYAPHVLQAMLVRGRGRGRGHSQRWDMDVRRPTGMPWSRWGRWQVDMEIPLVHVGMCSLVLLQRFLGCGGDLHIEG